MINKLLYYPLNAFTYNDLRIIIIIFYSMAKIRGTGKEPNKRKSKIDLVLERLDKHEDKFNVILERLDKLENLVVTQFRAHSWIK